MSTPEKLAIDNKQMTAIYYTDESLKPFGLDIEKLKALFARMGITQGKRPVHKRSRSASYYD